MKKAAVERKEITQELTEFNLDTYLNKISRYGTLTMEEERALAKLAKEGSEEAKEILTKSNLKLVVTIAKKMLHCGKLSISDLIQEGNLGLITAVDKYNYKLGYRFATYAAWWIKQYMFKAVSEQSYAMRIPVYVQETIAKYTKVKAEMESDGEGSVSTERVAKRMNIEAEKINTYLNAFNKMLSLDGDFDGDGQKDLTLSEVIEDKRSSANRDAEYKNLTEDINALLNTLKDREKVVLKKRFGLFEQEKQTLEEIGNLYGVTKECIRQTESRALKKLKNNSLTEELYNSYVC